MESLRLLVRGLKSAGGQAGTSAQAPHRDSQYSLVIKSHPQPQQVPLPHQVGPPSPHLPALRRASGPAACSAISTGLSEAVTGGRHGHRSVHWRGGVQYQGQQTAVGFWGEGLQGCGMASAVNIVHNREADDLVAYILATSHSAST